MELPPNRRTREEIAADIRAIEASDAQTREELRQAKEVLSAATGGTPAPDPYPLLGRRKKSGKGVIMAARIAAASIVGAVPALYGVKKAVDRGVFDKHSSAGEVAQTNVEKGKKAASGREGIRLVSAAIIAPKSAPETPLTVTLPLEKTSAPVSAPESAPVIETPVPEAEMLKAFTFYDGTGEVEAVFWNGKGSVELESGRQKMDANGNFEVYDESGELIFEAKLMDGQWQERVLIGENKSDTYEPVADATFYENFLNAVRAQAQAENPALPAFDLGLHPKPPAPTPDEIAAETARSEVRADRAARLAKEASDKRIKEAEEGFKTKLKEAKTPQELSAEAEAKAAIEEIRTAKMTRLEKEKKAREEVLKKMEPKPMKPYGEMSDAEFVEDVRAKIRNGANINSILTGPQAMRWNKLTQ